MVTKSVSPVKILSGSVSSTFLQEEKKTKEKRVSVIKYFIFFCLRNGKKIELTNKLASSDKNDFCSFCVP